MVQTVTTMISLLLAACGIAIIAASLLDEWGMLRAALGLGRDTTVAPLPPHIQFKQKRAFMPTLAKGDEREGSIIVDTARQVLSSVLPGEKT